MTPRTRLIVIISAAVAVVALIVVAVFVNMPQEAEPEPTRSPSSGGVITQAPTAEPEPAETVEPAPDPTSPEAMGHGDDQNGATDATLDEAYASYAKRAEEFLNQYLVWDSAESPESRAARIAPYVAPDSPLLTQVPAISLSEENPTWGFTSKSTLDIVPEYTSWGAPDADNDPTLMINVMGNFTIATVDGAGMGGEGGGSTAWRVAFGPWNGQAELTVTDVIEPDYLN